MYAEKLLLEGCFKSIDNRLKSTKEILYAEDETGNYVVIDGYAAFRINDMFNSEVVCKMLHHNIPYGGIGKMFERDDFETVHKICEIESSGRTLVQFDNETGHECYMDKKYYTIIKKIEKETINECQFLYSPEGKLFTVRSGYIRIALVLPVIP